MEKDIQNSAALNSDSKVSSTEWQAHLHEMIPRVEQSDPHYVPGVACPVHTTEAKLLRKLDLHVIPCLTTLYFLAFLDRVNIANARAFGLEKDLHLGKNQYNTALTIFFVPYILCEIPSNLLLKHLRPHVWLSACTFMFGVVTVCQGFVQNYQSLLVTRFFLGLFEAGLFPGCFYVIGMWYKRLEAQRRYTFFFGSTSLAGVFGGLLASAIAKMDGIHGYNGWRWILIVEGGLTAVVALVLFFFLPSFPEESTWFLPAEKAFMIGRLEADQSRTSNTPLPTLRGLWRVLMDPKIVLGGLMYLSLVVSAYGYAFFAPSILATFDYTPIQALLHSVAPWACAFVFSMLIACASDLSRHRFFFVLATICIAITGDAILLSHSGDPALHYVSLFFVTTGAFSAMPLIVCWCSMNLHGHLQRGVGIASQIGLGNIGGIIATYSFLDQDAPYYTTGYGICLGFLCFCVVCSCAYAALLTWENRKRQPIECNSLPKVCMKSEKSFVVSRHLL